MKRHVLTGIELIAAGEASLLKATRQITGCGACDGSASRTFQSTMGQVLGSSGTTEYFMCCPVECPRCASPIFESTLVSTEGNTRSGDHELGLFDPPLTETNLVFVDAPTLTAAEEFISGCEHCAPEAAEITFDYLLDAITGCDPTITEYVICRAAKCPGCNHNVMEKTLVVTSCQ